MTLPSHIITFAELPTRKESRFALSPSTDDCSALAEALGVDALRKARFEGSLRPLGKSDWRLEASYGATVVQPCVVILDPVSTRLVGTVERNYLSRWEEPEAAEAEMPEDTASEAVPLTLNLYALLLEELALAIPDFPRADGAVLEQAQYAEDGVTPMTDDDAKPFAGLAGLRDQLKGDD